MFDGILIHLILSHYVAQNVIHSGDYDQLIESKALWLRFFPFHFFSIDIRAPDVIPFLFFHDFLSKVLNFLFPLFLLFNSHYPYPSCTHIYGRFDCVFTDEIFSFHTLPLEACLNTNYCLSTCHSNEN
jgi:hypothetical protein